MGPVSNGIDLSAEPARTAVCTIDWAAGRVAFLERPADDDRLTRAVLSAGKTGVDAPFGWPDAFVAAIVAHHDRRSWPGHGRPARAYRRSLRYRLTDVVVAADGRWPLSVSSDLIAVPAMRCADLQDRVRRIEPVDRSGLAGRLAEVYPAAALRAWGLPATGYKGPRNRRLLAELVDRVLTACPSLRLHPADRAMCAAADDAFDALVCALVARAVVLGLTHPPQPEHLDQARREGWIHVPACGLGELCAAGAR